MEVKDKPQNINIGTRSSPLALAQAEYVRDQMRASGAFDDCEIILVPLTTRGDQILDKPLAEIGGKGLFTAELDLGLENGSIDLAVHSLKDLPTEGSDLLTIAATPKRADVRDCLILNKAAFADTNRFEDLPEGARIGTASLRRAAQILARRPDIEIISLRGNVGTRIRKMEEQGLAGIVLARAGLDRLGYSEEIGISLDTEFMLPAAGQGALAIQCLTSNTFLRERLGQLHDPLTHQCVAAERKFLNRLEGNCRTPIAAHATMKGDEITLIGRVLSLDGAQMGEATGSVEHHNALALADNLAETLIETSPELIPRPVDVIGSPQRDY